MKSDEQMVERVARAIRDAIDDSNLLSAGPRDVGEEYHGVKGLTQLFVDGAFDLNHVARAALAASDRDVLVAEIERLREALRDIEKIGNAGFKISNGRAQGAVEIARAALLPLGGGS